MDNKITKKRFANMWAYDWIKMLGVLVAVILLWVLLFDMLAPRMRAGQDFSVFMYYSVGGNASDKLYDEMESKEVLSYDVLKLTVSTFEEKYIGQLMSTRASTHEGDILILDRNTSKTEVTLDGEEKKEVISGNYQAVVDNYSIYDIDELIKDALYYYASFTVKYADGKESIEDVASLVAELKADGDDVQLDGDTVYAKFKTRKKKDNAYKTKTQYENGAKKDAERLEKLKSDALRVYDVLSRLDGIYTFENNPIRANYRKYEITYYSDPSDEDYKKAYEKSELKTYGIDLGGIDGIEIDGENVYRENRRVGEDYKIRKDIYGDIPAKSSGADGVVVCVFDYKKYQPDLQYETVGFLRYIFDTYTTL